MCRNPFGRVRKPGAGRPSGKGGKCLCNRNKPELMGP